MTTPQKEPDPATVGDPHTRLERLQRERQQIVASLSEENARLLFARQRASGAEIEVLAAERAQDASAIAGLHEWEAAARRELAETEQRIEDLESRMLAIISSLAAPND